MPPAVRLGGIVAGQQPGAEVGLADPAAGIDPRTDGEAQIARRSRACATRPASAIARQAGVAAARHDLQSLRDEGAVDTGERHHVADGAQRHQIEPLPQVGLRLRGIAAGAAQQAVGVDDQQKGKPGGTQVVEAAAVVGTLRIDDGDRRWQRQVRLVMIDDDDIEAAGGRIGQRVVGGDAAIDGDHQRDGRRGAGPRSAGAFGP